MDTLVTSCAAAAISSLPDGRRRLLEARLGPPPAPPPPHHLVPSAAAQAEFGRLSTGAVALPPLPSAPPTAPPVATAAPGGAPSPGVVVPAAATAPTLRPVDAPVAVACPPTPLVATPPTASCVRDHLLDASRSFVLTGDEAEDEDIDPPAAAVARAPGVAGRWVASPEAAPVDGPTATVPVASAAGSLGQPLVVPVRATIRPACTAAAATARGTVSPGPPEQTAEDSFGSFSSGGSRGSTSAPRKVRVVTPNSRRTQPPPPPPPGASNSSRDSGAADAGGLATGAAGGGATGRRAAGGSSGRKRGRGATASFEPTKNARLEQYFKPAAAARAARLAAGSPASSAVMASAAAAAAAVAAGLSPLNSRSSRLAPEGGGGATCSSWGVAEPPGDSQRGEDRPPPGPVAGGIGGAGNTPVHGAVVPTGLPSSSLGAAASPIRNNGGQLPTPRRLFEGMELREAGSATTSAPSSPALRSRLGLKADATGANEAAPATAAAAVVAAETAAAQLRAVKEEAAALKAELARTTATMQAAVDAAKAMAAREAAAARDASAAATESRLAAASAASEASAATETVTATRSALETHVRSLARHQRAEAVAAAAEKSRRLGHIEVQRSGTSLHEVWEDGAELKEMGARMQEIATRKEATEKRRKEVAKQLRALSASTPPLPPASSPSGRSREAVAAAAAAVAGATGGNRASASAVPHVATAAYLVEQEEVYKLQLLSLKKDEGALAEQRGRAEAERALLIRELKRQRDEAASRFHDFPTLNGRYLLMSLLGRGGFSEVYKAYDLVGLRLVACKIHQLGTYWREERKRNYIRHATREYRIHKALRHPRVVQLIDVFEIDASSFCTVLEYCDGGDLDGHLMAHKTLPEREARSITAQVLAGLLYLSEQPQRVIHYDLKPGNILFHEGEARITDFGLSKQMDAAAGSAVAPDPGGAGASASDGGVELTSQGAGTYWYLPPECFKVGDAPQKISAKVDVWSTGVILYQMLFGRRPFGHDLTQEGILRDHSVLSGQLLFPARPGVSDLAKAFLIACLTPAQAERPNIRELLQHPFIRAGRKALA
ncbi:hypothetical protein MMPV_004485 [Pyropia vietnamensis]